MEIAIRPYGCVRKKWKAIGDSKCFMRRARLNPKGWGRVTTRARKNQPRSGSSRRTERNGKGGGRQVRQGPIAENKGCRKVNLSAIFQR